jgi:hypothetical protein
MDRAASAHHIQYFEIMSDHVLYYGGYCPP